MKNKQLYKRKILIKLVQIVKKSYKQIKLTFFNEIFNLKRLKNYVN